VQGAWRDGRRERSPALVAGAVLVLAALALLCLDAAGASAKTVWLCRPGLANDPCAPSLKTTKVSNSGQNLGVVDPKPVKHPKVDCFYVYPTVSDQSTENANLTIDPEERSIALYQAARYSQYCHVFAPMYRQLTLAGIFGQVSPDAAQIAYQSALSGWKTYLRKYNDGRPFILIGHSQGTFVLRRLIASQIDPKRSLRRRLVSAILLGGNVTVKKGSDRGGDFQNIRACHSPTQTRCVVAYSTFNGPVPQDSVFGRTTNAGQHVLCRNPAAIAGGSGPVKAIMPTTPFAPGTTIGAATQAVGFPTAPVSTPWVEYDQAYTAACSPANGANVLQLTDRPGVPHLNPVPNPGWGLHLTDANIALGNLTALVKRQIKAFGGVAGVSAH
jgi:DUF3089 family protein